MTRRDSVSGHQYVLLLLVERRPGWMYLVQFLDSADEARVKGRRDHLCFSTYDLMPFDALRYLNSRAVRKVAEAQDDVQTYSQMVAREKGRTFAEADEA